jgi:ribonuclease PH
MREDARKESEMRKFSCEMGFVKEAEGSARVLHGDTHVICSIHGPSQPKYNRQEFYNRGHLEIDYRMCGYSGQEAMNMEKEGTLWLEHALENAVKLEKYPRTLFTIRVIVVQDDGSVKACALHASALAIMDAGVEMNAIPCAICFSLSTLSKTDVDDGDRDNVIDDENIEGVVAQTLLIDPTKIEEENADACIAVTFDDIFKKEPLIVATRISGELSSADMLRAIQFATHAEKFVANSMLKLARS